jgi:hypothetical protein
MAIPNTFSEHLHVSFMTVHKRILPVHKLGLTIRDHNKRLVGLHLAQGRSRFAVSASEKIFRWIQDTHEDQHKLDCAFRKMRTRSKIPTLQDTLFCYRGRLLLA